MVGNAGKVSERKVRMETPDGSNLHAGALNQYEAEKERGTARAKVTNNRPVWCAKLNTEIARRAFGG